MKNNTHIICYSGDDFLKIYHNKIKEINDFKYFNNNMEKGNIFNF